MMQRRSALLALAVAVGVVPSGVAWAAAADGEERRASALPSVKVGIMDATGYAESDLDLVLQSSQFMVTIFNSALNKSASSARESEATRIVASISRGIAKQPDFATILGIHIDYVSRRAGSTHTDLVDGIDFRKDPAGAFVHHTT